MPVSPKRTAALAEWLQELYRADETPPILVGGSAVELYTLGAYVTGDLDLVGAVPSHVRKALAEAGFSRKGRHWIHEEGRIFLEFPSSSLSPSEEFERREFNSHYVVIVSPEDLIVDRLSAWVHWNSEIDGVNAYLLFKALATGLDHERILKRCMEEEVTEAFGLVKELFHEHEGELPDRQTLERWVKTNKVRRNDQ